MKRRLAGMLLKWLGLILILPLTPFALAAHYLFRLIEYGGRMADEGKPNFDDWEPGHPD